ncbi:MAG: trehalose utilization protein ThuA [Lentisphaeria bacterium]|nr:trehalose utilization protein ThuA [Lentisphaeria bacterium]
MKNIRVTIWNEFVHEREAGPVGEHIRSIYPEGIHAALAAELAAPGLELRTATLDEPEQGLPEPLLGATDVLVWWGHCAHDRVDDRLTDRIQQRVLSGMGLVVLHSGHCSKVFRRLMGTDCRLRWREIGEKERLWTAAPGHPVAAGVPETFTLPHSEMYGEPFGVPDDGKVVFMSWFEGGNVFRSGVAFERGAGRIFYFSPGHETYPIYRDANVLRVIGNALRWAASPILPPRVTPQPEPLEPVRTADPLAALDTESLHEKQ